MKRKIYFIHCTKPGEPYRSFWGHTTRKKDVLKFCKEYKQRGFDSVSCRTMSLTFYNSVRLWDYPTAWVQSEEFTLPCTA